MVPDGPQRLPPNDSPAEERRRTYRRVREVLIDAGWLFDDFVNGEMRNLNSAPDDMTSRELAYNPCATELKAHLADLVEEYEADAKLKERREQLKESLYGRRS